LFSGTKNTKSTFEDGVAHAARALGIDFECNSCFFIVVLYLHEFLKLSFFCCSASIFHLRHNHKFEPIYLATYYGILMERFQVRIE
jgi:hypothetical protein